MAQDKDFLSASTVAEVCAKLEDTLGELRQQRRLDLLPSEFHSISARTATDVRTWCERLERSEHFASGRLDGYFILFDTARVRLEQIKSKLNYEVYARKREAENQYSIRRRRYSDLDEAVTACIALVQDGHRIIKVKLPSGAYVMGGQIEWAITIGRQSLKVALRHPT